MAAELRILTRVSTNVDGSPGGTGNIGNLAANASAAALAANNGAPKLFLSDGTQWLLLNAAAQAPTVGTVNLPGGTQGSSTGIGAAWTAFSPKPTDPIIIVSFAGSAYIKTGAGGADGDWTNLGSSTQFATTAEVRAGTDTTKAINSAGLQSRLKATPDATPANDANLIVMLDAGGKVSGGFLSYSTGAEVLAGTVDNKPISPAGLASLLVTAPDAAPANDAGKVVALNAAGQIPVGFLPPFTAVTYVGMLAHTDAAPTAPSQGDLHFFNSSGNLTDASWGALQNTAVESGDAAIYNGSVWQLLQSNIDPSVFVSKAGDVMNANAALTWPGATTAEAGNTLLDLRGGTIEHALLDAGTY